MPVFVALLRGVNVGGKQKLSSADFKKVCEATGCSAVRIYLQSGNAVFQTSSRSAARVSEELRAELKRASGLDVAVLVRSPQQLRKVVDGNPFADAAGAEPNRVMVLFLSGPLGPPAKTLLAKERAADEAIVPASQEVYVHFPSGAGRSKLATVMTPKRLGVECTMRNWNTVTALLEIAEDLAK